MQTRAVELVLSLNGESNVAVSQGRQISCNGRMRIDVAFDQQFKQSKAMYYAVGWAILGNFLYATENAIAKTLSSEFHPIQVLFVYGSVMLGITVVTIWVRTEFGQLRTTKVSLLTFRSFTMVGTFYAYIEALKYLQLADVIAIVFITPFVATLLSWPLLSERIDRTNWFLLSFAFLGVIIVVDPSAELNVLGLAWALASALLGGLDSVLTRKLALTESNLTIVFYLSVFYVIATGSFAPFVWVSADLESLIYLLSMGVVGALAQYTVTHAYKFAGPPVIAPLDYTILLWGILFGYLIWNDLPAGTTYLGSAVLITCSTLMIFRKRSCKP